VVALFGLGNPGSQYSNTKHNFGFWIVDRIAEKRSLKFKAGKGDYLFVKDGDLLLVKPTTFMNNSGLAVADVCRYFKISVEDILVMYDDIDIPLGTIRFKSDGGTGGHRGVESTIYHLKTENFNRLKLGIATDGPMRPSEKYVLSPFSKQFQEDVSSSIEYATSAVEYFLNHSISETMNKFN
jgi:PTH1 family peptidyl-tRNA hydrolase